MKSLSIRTQVVALILVGVAAVTTVIAFYVSWAFERNMQTMAKESLASARAAFASLQKADTAMLGVAGELVLDSKSRLEAYVERDRTRLINELRGPYARLRKDYGVTHLNYITPDRKIFVRMSKPTTFGETIDRDSLTTAMKTNTFTSGLELGRTGFVLRTVRPVADESGTIGYLEVGEEVGTFSSRLKEQTGFDLGLLLLKKYMKGTGAGIKDDWGNARKEAGQRDNWNDHPDVVVAQTTTEDESLLDYPGDMESLPAEGKVLERFKHGDKVLMRGLFPVLDPSGAMIGAIFVLRDITEMSGAVDAARRGSILITIFLGLLLAVAAWFALERLVFRRLNVVGQRLEELSLRVAGGDFDIETAMGGKTRDDEIGRLEQFLGQFLVLIGNTLKSLFATGKRVEDDNRELQSSIKELLGAVSQASDGDLTIRAKVTVGALGNVADAFNQLLESLQRLVGEILAQQNRTNLVVTSIRKAAESMALGATQQAGELVSATELVERINVEIERVSQHAQNAADSSKHTEASAVDGVKAVGNIITGMEQLRSSVQAGAKKVKSLGERSMEITSIVSAINRVSEQTNMLALNAAIEAARAGEHGRGFSVVAEEVRKLAERTAGATLEIDKLVKSIQSETNETVSAIEVQTDVVERESAMVGQAGSSLARIREVSTTSAGLVIEISSVAKQQVESTRAVVKVMAQVSAIAQKTQGEAQSTAVNVGELVKASDSLAESIRRFRLS
jgi:methyl-accepting chemotaxis protein